MNAPEAEKNTQSNSRDSVITYEKLAERRSTPRDKTPFFRVMLALNILGWVGLVVALLLFHYARPDFVSGVQSYWGIEGDTSWSQTHLSAMTIMLQICLVLSLISIVMRARRNRRQSDNFGVNLFVLLAIVVISLITLATTLGF
tara:strand:- start:1606 stop:2037 length:432 start_codon:yes stop_codon:yes gene_type:complete